LLNLAYDSVLKLKERKEGRKEGRKEAGRKEKKNNKPQS